MIRGRPIRFLMTVVGGWTAIRFAMVLPLSGTSLSPNLLRSENGRSTAGSATLDWMFPPPPAARRPRASPSGHLHLASTMSNQMSIETVIAQSRSPGRNPRNPLWSVDDTDEVVEAPLAFTPLPQPPPVLANFAPGFGLSPGELGAPVPERRWTRADRWSGVAWLLGRGGGSAGTPARLGGSQAGMRLDYLLASASPLRPTVYGRISSAVGGVAAAEGAAGIAIHPDLPFPVIVAVERRQAVSAGGRSDFAILAAGGINPIEIGQGLRLDGYAQAGFVGIERRDAFADGRLTLERPIAKGGAGQRIALGAAVWGGAQPGLSRLDIGPQASMRVQLGRASMRLGAEWRAQVAGNAGPSSGAAISLGADF